MKYVKKYKGELITFFFTIIFLMILFKIIGILDGNMVVANFNDEFNPMLIQLKRIILGESGLFNFNTMMGSSFLGTFYSYVSTIFIPLKLIISNKNVFAVTFIISKLALASVFCYRYLKYQFKEEKISYLAVFSVLYALSSYSISYYIHIMWLDIYMLFPLVLLGIDKMIKENKKLLYIISLALVIFSNYYLAYMVCIFVFLYYNYKILLNKISLKEWFQKNIKFVVISFFICLTMSFVFLPVLSELGTYSRENDLLFGGEGFKFTLKFKEFVNYYIIGDFSKMSYFNDNDFYIYTSIIVIPLLYFYFVNKDISKREKILSIGILSILGLSMCFNYVDYIWYMFKPIICWNGRYTFMFILFILYLSTKSIYNLKDFKLRHYVIVFLAVFIPVVINSLVMEKYLSIINIFKLVMYLIYILALKLINSNKKVNIIIIALIIIELMINDYSYLDRYKFSYNYPTDERFKSAVDFIKNTDNSFYRIEDNFEKIYNYSLQFNYNGIDCFTSTVNKDLVKFFNELNTLNHSFKMNCINYDGSNHLVSSLLNVKYYIDTYTSRNLHYKSMDENKETYFLFENEKALSLGYLINKDAELNKNGLENINNIYKNITGNEKNVLEKVELNKINEKEFSFINSSKRDFYVLVDLPGRSGDYGSLKVKINDNKIDDRLCVFMNYIENTYKENEEIKIKLEANDKTLNDIEGIYVYYYNNEVYEEDINILKENELQVTGTGKNYLEGKIDLDKAGMMFLSIPYSNDLDVYVDGIKTDKTKLFNAFIGVSLDKGEHNIVVKYTPKILYISIIPSIIGAILLVIYLKKSRKE